jgi:hypothetical protein
MEERTAKKQRASSGKRNRIKNGSGLIKGAIIINLAYAVTQMCQTVSASTQRKSFEAAAKGFFPDYMVSFRNTPVDVPRGPPPQRRINIYISRSFCYIAVFHLFFYLSIITFLIFFSVFF